MDPIVLIPITLIFALAIYFGRNELVQRVLTCPVTGSAADVAVEQRVGRPDKPVQVKSCSLLPGSKRIECGQGCLNCQTAA